MRIGLKWRVLDRFLLSADCCPRTGRSRIHSRSRRPHAPPASSPRRIRHAHRFPRTPPYKTNLTTSLYNKPAPSPDPTKQSIFLIGKERVPSAEARSIELFMQEMDETETERAVIMGRKADEYGSVDNDEIDELARAYPGRFIPFAGVNPNLPGQVEEIERVAAMGFRAWASTPDGCAARSTTTIRFLIPFMRNVRNSA